LYLLVILPEYADAVSTVENTSEFISLVAVGELCEYLAAGDGSLIYPK
jgi:hypothetical protein